MATKNDIIISGIGPSDLGVGRLMRHLEDLNEKREVKFLFKWIKRDEVKSCLKKRKYFSLLLHSLSTIANLLRFFYITSVIRNRTIVLIHPQTIGFTLFLNLIKRNKIKWYIMDSSFFCIKSYNYRIDIGECFSCIGKTSNCHQSCHPFPTKTGKIKNLKFLDDLHNYKNKIQFLVQNRSQQKLIYAHYGKDVDCRVIGMETGEISVQPFSSKDHEKSQFELVFHGSILREKGILYFLELAESIPEAKFFVPEDKVIVEEVLDIHITSTNITFQKCTWETGLREKVERSFITVCPSLWSSCVEGAVLKSLKYSNNVAMVKSENGFINDISEEVVLKLDSNIHYAGEEIRKAYKNCLSNKERANKWLKCHIINSRQEIKRNILN